MRIPTISPASLAQAEDPASALAAFVVVIGVILGLVIHHLLAQRRNLGVQARSVEAARRRAEAEAAAQAEQNEVNRLVTDKIRAEVEMLRAQAQAARREADNPAIREQQDLVIQRTRRELELLELQIRLATRELESREQQSILVDKARLEIESLRLQIIEQRKRLDDFGQYGEH